MEVRCRICSFSSTHLGQHVDMLVSLCKLSLKAGYLLTKLVDQLDLGVNVLSRLVCNERCLHGVIESTQVLLHERI